MLAAWLRNLHKKVVGSVSGRRSRLVPRKRQVSTRCSSAELCVLESRTYLAGFTPGNLVVSVIGTGSTLGASATSVSLREYGFNHPDAPTMATLVNTVIAPSSNVGNNSGNLTNSGNAPSEGTLNLAVDGSQLNFMGYDAPAGLAAVSGTTAAGNNRVIGTADASGMVAVGPRLTDAFSTGNARTAISVDGSAYWTGGANGVRYVGTNEAIQTTSTILLTASPPNIRFVSIATDRLQRTFLIANSIASVFAWPNPTLPKTATTAQSLLLPTLGSDLGEIVMLDRSPTLGATGLGGLDTIYVTNGQSSMSGSIAKFEWSGTAWQSRGSRSYSNGLNGLTARITATGDVQLFATTRLNTGNNQLVTLKDTSAFGSSLPISATYSVLATAGVGYGFRGVAFTPDELTTPFSLTETSALANADGGAVNLVESVALEDGSSFKGGMLSVTGGESGDTFSIANLSGQITSVGSDVFYDGSLIGTVSGGIDATPLTVTFNPRHSTNDVSSAAVQQLIKQIQYGTTSSATSRTVTVTVTQAANHKNQSLSFSDSVSMAINQPPTEIAFQSTTTGINENTSTTDGFKVAEIVVTDDGVGTNVLTLSGADAENFEIVGTDLRIRSGTVLDFEAKNNYSVTVEVEDTAFNVTPRVSQDFTLSVIDLAEDTTPPTAEWDVLPATRTSAVGTVTIHFSEPVTGVDLTDFQLTRNGAAVSLAGLVVTQVTPMQYTVDLSSVTAAGGDYALSLVATESDIVNTVNTPLATNATTSWKNLQISSFVVQNGETQRSFVNQLDVSVAGLSDVSRLLSSGRIQLTRYDLNGANGLITGLGTVTAAGNSLRFHFGPQGVGGNRTNTAFDGYYQLQLDLDGNGTFESARSFYRLLGDFNGDRQVNTLDVNLVSAAMAQPYNSIYDIDGNGVINANDRSKVTISAKAKRKLLGSLVVSG